MLWADSSEKNRKESALRQRRKSEEYPKVQRKCKSWTSSTSRGTQRTGRTYAWFLIQLNGLTAFFCQNIETVCVLNHGDWGEAQFEILFIGDHSIALYGTLWHSMTIHDEQFKVNNPKVNRLNGPEWLALNSVRTRAAPVSWLDWSIWLPICFTFGSHAAVFQHVRANSISRTSRNQQLAYWKPSRAIRTHWESQFETSNLRAIRKQWERAFRSIEALHQNALKGIEWQ